MQRLKLIVIGESGVGKTQLALRFTENSFRYEQISTTGIDFTQKEVLIDGQTYCVQIWDTCGQEKYRSITESYFHRAQGALIAFDLSDADSLSHLSKWFNLLSRKVGSIPTVFAGTKDDLPHAINDQEAEDFSKSQGVSLFYTSAMSGANVEESLLELARLIITQSNVQDSDAIAGTQLKTKKKIGCC